MTCLKVNPVLRKISYDDSMKPTKKRILYADAALIVTATIWGINVFIVKDILASIDPFALVAQ